MKKLTFLLLLLPFIFSSCTGQNPQNYNKLIAEARDLYNTGEYEDSGEKYSEAFESIADNDSILHRYEAAQTWAMANNKDAAFDQLFEISEKGRYKDLGKISSDKDFHSLSTDERWMKVLSRVSENKKEAEAFVPDVVSILDTVYREDQYYRQQADGIREKYGYDSEEVRTHWELINKQDSVNLIKVKKILDEHGWLSSNLIGRKGNSALFLVIQHSDIDTQEKYLPMLREAVEKGNASPRDLALLEDRVALKQGKNQIYGSQIGINQETGEYYVSPLEDPDNVNERRAEVGLGPIEDYVANWNIIWDVESYKKKLPKLEAME